MVNHSSDPIDVDTMKWYKWYIHRIKSIERERKSIDEKCQLNLTAIVLMSFIDTIASMELSTDSNSNISYHLYIRNETVFLSRIIHGESSIIFESIKTKINNNIINCALPSKQNDQNAPVNLIISKPIKEKYKSLTDWFWIEHFLRNIKWEIQRW